MPLINTSGRLDAQMPNSNMRYTLFLAGLLISNAALAFELPGLHHKTLPATGTIELALRQKTMQPD